MNSNPYCGFRAALYIRLSREDENAGPSLSITNQKSMLESFAASNGIEIFDTYIDDGFSGTDFDRPGFLRMISHIEKHYVNMVITKDLSRLGRDYIMVGHFMEKYFPEHSVRYISLLDGIDTGIESTSNDITPFRAIMNDMYAKDISRKIKSVKRDKQEKGLFIGGKPAYGYMKDPLRKNMIVPDPPAASVVRRIFSMAVSGMTCTRIAENLNSENIPPPSSYAGLTVGHPGPQTGLWSSRRISEMLVNEVYIGNMVQGRRKRASYKSRKCINVAPENWIRVPCTHEPIIDTETFTKAGLLLASRRRTRSRTYDSPLKGIILCHTCRSPLGLINRKNAAGKDVLYFMCRRCRKSCIIKEANVKSAIASAISESGVKIPSREDLEKTADNFVIRKNSCSTPMQDIALNRLDKNIDRIYMDYSEGLIDRNDFKRIYEKLRHQRSMAEKAAMSPGGAFCRQRDAAQDVNHFIEELQDSREFISAIIESIELTQDRKLIVKFRFREI